MNGLLGVWGRNLRLWLPSLLFFLLGLGAMLFYRAVLADDAELGQARLARRGAELEALRADHQRLSDYLQKASALEDGMGSFFGVRLASEADSLTKIIAEIKSLSEQAGLLPQTITYDKETVEGENVLRRTVTFSVDGSYNELRRLINFLELSDSFLILEEVTLRGDDAGGPTLKINPQISALFLAGSPAGEPRLAAVTEEAG